MLCPHCPTITLPRPQAADCNVICDLKLLALGDTSVVARLHADGCSVSASPAGCGCLCQLREPGFSVDDYLDTSNSTALAPDEAEALLGGAVTRVLSAPACAGVNWTGT